MTFSPTARDGLWMQPGLWVGVAGAAAGVGVLLHWHAVGTVGDSGGKLAATLALHLLPTAVGLLLLSDQFYGKVTDSRGSFAARVTQGEHKEGEHGESWSGLLAMVLASWPTFAALAVDLKRVLNQHRSPWT